MKRAQACSRRKMKESNKHAIEAGSDWVQAGALQQDQTAADRLEQTEGEAHIIKRK